MISKILNTFSIKFVSAIFNLLIAVIVSRYLGAIGKGEQSIILTTISFILIFVNVAGGATLVYLAPRFKLSRLITLSYSWSIWVAMISYFVLLFFKIVHAEFVMHICLLSLINSLAAINSNILLGKEKINASNWVNLLQPAMLLLSIFIFFNTGNASVSGYIYALYVAYIMSFILSVTLLYKISAHNLNIEAGWKPTVFAMFSMGFMNQMSHVTSLLNARLSYYLLDKYKGTGQLGIYSNGVSLTEAVFMVSGSMAMVQYAHIANSTDNKLSQQLTVNLTKISVLISVILIIPMVLLPSSFYSFIFGKEFVNINQIMLCLAPGVIFWNFSLLIGHYFSGIGKFYIEFAASVTGLIITLMLSFWAIPIWGFYGAGLISSFSYLANAIVLIYFLKRESGIGFLSLTPKYIDLKSYINNLKTLVIRRK